MPKTDEEVQKNLAPSKIPNKISLQAFVENKQKNMPSFDTVDELQKDLLS